MTPVAIEVYYITLKLYIGYRITQKYVQWKQLKASDHNIEICDFWCTLSQLLVSSLTSASGRLDSAT